MTLRQGRVERASVLVVTHGGQVLSGMPREVAFRHFRFDPRSGASTRGERIQGPLWVSDALVVARYGDEGAPLYRRSIALPDAAFHKRGAGGTLDVRIDEIEHTFEEVPQFVGWRGDVPADAGPMGQGRYQDVDFVSEPTWMHAWQGRFIAAGRALVARAKAREPLRGDTERSEQERRRRRSLLRRARWQFAIANDLAATAEVFELLGDEEAARIRGILADGQDDAFAQRVREGRTKAASLESDAQTLTARGEEVVARRLLEDAALVYERIGETSDADRIHAVLGHDPATVAAARAKLGDRHPRSWSIPKRILFILGLAERI